jgi:anti-anti-sigma factor
MPSTSPPTEVPPEIGGTSFSVTTQSHDGRRVIDVRGEVDVNTAPSLQPVFEEALKADGDVIVDLCGASFMDSSGLYALLVFRTRLEEHDRRLAVAVWPAGAIAMLFRVSGTDGLFEIHASRAAALSA